MRDIKLFPESQRSLIMARRLKRKKIGERISALSGIVWLSRHTIHIKFTFTLFSDVAACTVNLIICLFISSRNNVIEEAEYWLRWKYLIWAFIVVTWLYLWLCSNYHHPHVGYWWWWQRAALCNGFTSWGNSCENWWWSLNTQLCDTVGAEEVYYKVWRYLVLLCIRVVVMCAK